MNHAITADDLHLAYTGQSALNGVSLRIWRGEFFGIIGPNGSGKTTLLRSLAGTIIPDRGTIRILGRDIASYSRRDLARTMALVPQLPDQDFTFTVREVVLMGRSPHLGLWVWNPSATTTSPAGAWRPPGSSIWPSGGCIS